MSEREIIRDAEYARALANGCGCDYLNNPDTPCVLCREERGIITTSLVAAIERATAAEARVAELLSDRAEAAEVLVAEVERAQAAERRAAELTAALREYAPQCHHCPRVRTQMWRVDSLRKRGLCDVCARSYSPCEDTPDAAVLRSLDGVSR